ncbi:nicotinamide riboside transporter PnuC [Candidiatus Paracoxiella cheracis]|uniref:nicotinamide riboside transporter PnuC n=1 Tax=Candidiatus Paracoxiella cheracis TaxID=3405120 RepID=UPI003BF4C1C6
MQAFIHTLDIVGAVFALLSTIFYVKADKWAWPLGLVATVLDATLYGLTGIYGDMTLAGIYFISMFYGWYMWTHKNNRNEALAITHLTWRVAFILCVIAVAGIFSVAELLKHFTNSQVPYLDATTTVLSLIAQWMICKKIIENWILWFVVDAIYVGLYFYKDIPAHSILLIIYLGLAVTGFIRWRHLIAKQNPTLLSGNYAPE